MDDVRVLVTPRVRARRFSSNYVPPSDDEIAALRAALFSALPPEDYLRRTAARVEAPDVVKNKSWCILTWHLVRLKIRL
eukprot:719580-Amphidinium_carterae.1